MRIESIQIWVISVHYYSIKIHSATIDSYDHLINCQIGP